MTTIHVIIPVYNAIKYLREAVDSVLNQPYKNIDIVLVNDGSTDGSAELCDEIAANEERVCVIHQVNQGVSVARNAGIDYALSKHKNEAEYSYIAFLDADDKWAADFFDSTTLSLFSKGYSLIGFQSCICNAELTRMRTLLPLKAGLYEGGCNAIWIYGGQLFCAMLYSAKLLQKYNIRFISGLKFSEDKIFNMQCLYLADCIYLENKRMHYYRMVANSAMHSRKNGIAYYEPIIEAYLASDGMMSYYTNAQRGELNGGKILAGIYVMDMLEEHYEDFGNRKEVKQLFFQHPEYVELMNTPLIRHVAKANARWNRMNNHLYSFRLRCYLRGLRKKFMRTAYTLVYKEKHIAAMIDKKRYPVMIDK